MPGSIDGLTPATALTELRATTRREEPSSARAFDQIFDQARKQAVRNLTEKDNESPKPAKKSVVAKTAATKKTDRAKSSEKSSSADTDAGADAGAVSSEGAANLQSTTASESTGETDKGAAQSHADKPAESAKSQDGLTTSENAARAAQANTNPSTQLTQNADSKKTDAVQTGKIASTAIQQLDVNSPGTPGETVANDQTAQDAQSKSAKKVVDGKDLAALEEKLKKTEESSGGPQADISEKSKAAGSTQDATLPEKVRSAKPGKGSETGTSSLTEPADAQANNGITAGPGHKSGSGRDQHDGHGQSPNQLGGAPASTEGKTVANAAGEADGRKFAVPEIAAKDGTNLLVQADPMSSSTAPHVQNNAPATQPNPTQPDPAMTAQRFAEANHASIVAGVRGNLLPNGGSMQIRLDPPELGALNVQIEMKNGQMNAMFQTSNDDATKLLSHSLGQLKTALESQGVNVDKIQVQQSPKENFKHSHDTTGQNPQQDQAQAKQDQERKDMIQKMWNKLRGVDDLDMVA